MLSKFKAPSDNDFAPENLTGHNIHKMCFARKSTGENNKLHRDCLAFKKEIIVASRKLAENEENLGKISGEQDDISRQIKDEKAAVAKLAELILPPKGELADVKSVAKAGRSSKRAK